MYPEVVRQSDKSHWLQRRKFSEGPRRQHRYRNACASFTSTCNLSVKNTLAPGDGLNTEVWANLRMIGIIDFGPV